MSNLILVPYDASMRLGQGYNSYLQTSCIDDAVEARHQDIVRKPDGDQNLASQKVHYSSKVVDKISQVAQELNVSASASIKNGGNMAMGGSVLLDEGKFTSKSLNAMVHVKVINATVEMCGTETFKPIETIPFDDGKFLTVYGDCYISGFVEGGELVGIISANIADNEKKTEAGRALEEQLKTWRILGKRASLNETSALHGVEPTITVIWSGGGKIKPDSEEWTIGSLLNAASQFSDRVVISPQRTWAILTPYMANKSFVAWAKESRVEIPRFDLAQSVTYHLLDMYTEYKFLHNWVQKVLSSPDAYHYVPVATESAEEVDLAKMSKTRVGMRDQLRLISRVVDKIATNPEQAGSIKGAAAIMSPMIYAVELPILRVVGDGFQIDSGRI